MKRKKTCWIWLLRLPKRESHQLGASGAMQFTNFRSCPYNEPKIGTPLGRLRSRLGCQILVRDDMEGMRVSSFILAIQQVALI